MSKVYRKACQPYRTALVPAAVGTALILAFLLTIVFYWQQNKTLTDVIIAGHIKSLSTIFEDIERTCNIVSFEHDKNYIDFLTVKEFVGSEVGAMNLRYPERWQGPYVADNYTLQQKMYQIVRTKKGYFIVPGEGVRLGNGKEIGVDIQFDEDSDIDAMLVDPDQLLSDGQVLGARIKF